MRVLVWLKDTQVMALAGVLAVRAWFASTTALATYLVSNYKLWLKYVTQFHIKQKVSGVDINFILN